MSDLVKTNIEWIGYTQSNWKIGKVLQFFYEGRNRNIGVKNQNLLSLSYGNIVEKDINTSEGLLPASFSTYNIVEQGDIIIRPTDLQNDKVSLRTGLVKERGIITSAYIDLRPNEGVNSNFFHKVLHSYDVCKVFYNMGSGVRQGIGFADIANLVVFVPPLEEQKKIADFLDDKCAQIDEITKDLEKKINKLEDIKKSVIFESVTKGLDKNVVMKESGYSWLGKIPAHWTKCKVKDLFYRKNKKALQKDPIVLSLARDAVKIRDISTNEGQLAASYYEYNPVEPGDLLLNPMDLQSGANCSVSKVSGVISPAYINLRSNGLADPRFYDYYFKIQYWSFAFFSYGKGVSYDNRWTLNTDTLLNYVAFKIPLEEQKKIADFLDDKCAQIDEITKATREEIETLKQFKQSLIYEYVTGKKEVPNEQD